MPRELKRKMHLLRVKMPVLEGDSGDAGAVDVPLIDEIWFKDEQDDGTIYHFIFRNRKTRDGEDVPADNRKVHTVEVVASGFADCKIECERIETFRAKFPQQRNQVKTYVLRNGNASYIPRHFKTHNYTVGAQDGGNWIKLQRIDKLKVHDAQDDGQVKVFVLNWKKYENVDLSSVATLGNLDDGEDPPYRFDPFQNPIDLAGHEPGRRPSVEAGLLVLAGVNWMEDPRNYSLSGGMTIHGDGTVTCIPGFRSAGGGDWIWDPNAVRLPVTGAVWLEDSMPKTAPASHWGGYPTWGITDERGATIELTVDFSGVSVSWGDRTYTFVGVREGTEVSAPIFGGASYHLETDVICSAGIVS